jgi:parallel beta-helix repeat protein
LRPGGPVLPSAARPSRRAFLAALAIGVVLSPRTGPADTIVRRRAAAGRWNDVREFGAIGDGQADDTFAIQRTIDDAAAAGGGTVYFPAGIYTLRSTLVHRSDVTLLGAGWQSVLRGSVPNMTILDLIDCARSAVDSLRFTGSGTLGVAGRAAIHGTIGSSTGPIRCRIVRNLIEAVGTCAIALDNATQVLVEDNHIRRPVEHGIYLSSSTVGSTVSRNHILEAGYGGRSTVVGIKLAGPDCLRNTISRNVIDHPLTEGVICDTGSSDNLIEGNTVKNAPQRGVRIVADADRNLVRDNVLSGAGAEAILDMGSRRTLIEGNTVQRTGRAGIKLEAASVGVRVLGNHLLAVDGDSWSIDVSGSGHEIVANNISDQVLQGIRVRPGGVRITLDKNNNRASRISLSDRGNATTIVEYGP